MSEKYLDSSLTPEERAEDLLGRLSVEEKVYQISGIWAQMIDEPGQIDYGIGQVSTLEMRNIKTLQECVDWQIRMQKKIMGKSPHGIPATFHMEGLCGAFIQGAMSFPSGIGRGSSFVWNWKKKSGKSSVVRNRQLESHRFWHRFWMSHRIPEWGGRARPMVRIRP